jgi:hypothetical protein
LRVERSRRGEDEKINAIGDGWAGCGAGHGDGRLQRCDGK